MDANDLTAPLLDQINRLVQERAALIARIRELEADAPVPADTTPGGNHG